MKGVTRASGHRRRNLARRLNRDGPRVDKIHSFQERVLRLFGIGIVSLMLAALGARLLRLARRHRARPELWLGSAFLCAAVGTSLISIAAVETLPQRVALALSLWAQAGLSIAIACVATFTWSVFRPTSAAARALAPALIAANLAGGVAFWWSGSPLPVGRIGLCILLARNAVLMWLFVESALYARRMRRRSRLGLADPVLVNRFSLWAIWTGALAVIPLFALVLRMQGALVTPVPGAPLAAGLRAVFAVLGAGGAVATVACWLAFFPPAAYRRWITSRATAASV